MPQANYDDWRKRPRKPRPDLAERNRLSAKHGLTNTPTWKTWNSMMERCNNQRSKDYKNYGGRGIDICIEWRDFKVFLKDMGERPQGKTLGRIDNNAGYRPDNCRWETQKEQANNRRVNRHFEFAGKRKTIAEWAAEIGCSRQTLRWRLDSGWPIHEALTTSISHANRRTS